jgi:RNA polymerase sigma-70 factor, ECF subfamily
VRDRDEIEKLYRHHGAALVLFAASIARSRSRAQDAVHTVFVKLLDQGLKDRLADAKAYLFASVRNTVLNDLKRNERVVDLDPDSAWFDPPEHDHAAERQLQFALKELTVDQRQIVVMHIWGELTFGQISEVLGISPNTVASRYRYALNKLREHMSTPGGISCPTLKRTDLKLT